MEIRQSLEANFLTCRHCHQPYRKPKVLVCLHTFCQACLEQMVAQKDAENEAKELEATKRYLSTSNSITDYRSGYRKKWSSKFRNGAYDSYSSSNYSGGSRYPLWTSSRPKNVTCPVCEKETALSSGGVADLPTDQLADRLASMVDRMPTFPVCDVCTKQLLLTDSMENSDIQTSQSSNSANSNAANYEHTNSKITSYTSLNRTNGRDDSYSSDESGQDGSVLEANGSNRLVQNGHLRVGNNHNSRRRLLSSTSTKSGHPRSRTRAASSDKSSSDNGPRPANAACLECAKRLCASCRDTHAKMAVTANHVLIRVEQMDDLKCNRHPRELRRFFCLTCRMYICIVCTFETSSDGSGRGSSTGANGHAEHEIMSIREAVTAYQNQLSRDSASTQAHINQIESLLNSLQVCEMEMQNLYAAIDSGGKFIEDQLHIQQRKLKDRVDTLAGIPLEILSNECKRLNRATNEWYEFLNDDRITSRLDLMDPLEALTEAGPMLDRVNRCLRAASEPLNKEMARQPFLQHLKAAEASVLNNDDSGLVSSQSVSPASRSDSADKVANSRANYWRACLGKFRPVPFDFGRIVTDKELAAEAKAKAARRVTTCVQTGPELIRSLPPPKGAQRHRAVQINFLGANLDDRGVQTEPCYIGNMKPNRVDVGTQYQSSDVNPPVSMYRSLKQILVQK
ncbi:hypothetical protein P879_01779 [Paragonimus westermani]|uniref:B box-type domain-containing protein n=1 Tax=Paragonimus westermani TaxID=34504 RepID=A0A8T0DL71_9TREM|nr:hypothetical protein P879_01779 [Paragonimus westermani]